MNTPAPAILRLDEVKRRTGLGRSSIYERMSRNTFPASVSLGVRAVGWHESDVTAWIASLTPTTHRAKLAEGVQ